MKVLLIGGTGVLSSAITKKIIDQGFEVTMINRGNRKIPEGVNIIKTDKNNYPYIEQCLQGQFYDAVIDFIESALFILGSPFVQFLICE